MLPFIPKFSAFASRNQFRHFFILFSCERAKLGRCATRADIKLHSLFFEETFELNRLVYKTFITLICRCHEQSPSSLLPRYKIFATIHVPAVVHLEASTEIFSYDTQNWALNICLLVSASISSVCSEWSTNTRSIHIFLSPSSFK